MPKSNVLNLKLDKRYIFLGLFLLLTLYVIIPQLGDFKSSIDQLSSPDLFWTVLAILFTLFTYFSAAGTYYFLAFKKLKYYLTVLVQVAVMFINRLLPGGLGALGANYLYMKRQKHTDAQAASVIAVNNLLGFIGHNLLFWTVVLFSGYSAMGGGKGSPNTTRNFMVVILIISTLIGILALLFGRNKVTATFKDIKKQLLEYRHRPRDVVLALFATMTLTIFNVLCLYACAQAIGVHLNFAIIFLVFTFGLTAGTLTPTPGGLGGFEAGLVAGFVAYRVDSSTALAIALLYRLISYWLPLVFGAIAFIASQRMKLFSN